jgi:glycine cleavage system H protein
VTNEPVKITAGPLDEGWFFKLKIANPDELKGLMDGAAYNN